MIDVLLLFLFDYWLSTGWVEVLHTWLQISSNCGLKEIVRWIVRPRSTSVGSKCVSIGHSGRKCHPDAKHTTWMKLEPSCYYPPKLQSLFVEGNYLQNAEGSGIMLVVNCSGIIFIAKYFHSLHMIALQYATPSQQIKRQAIWWKENFSL